MKNSELRGMTLEELQGKLSAEKEGLAKLKFAHAITPIENPMRLKEAKKLVARISTEIRAKELAQK